MGREVRRVPPDWQHPKDERTGRYRPLCDGSDLRERVAEWKAGFLAWERGERSEYAKDCAEYWDFEGDPPKADNCMPVWTPEQATHLQMYEDTSEGTPISPVMESPEALARWLTDNGASAFGDQTGSYEGWLRVCHGGWAPSMVIAGNVMQTGVDFKA